MEIKIGDRVKVNYNNKALSFSGVVTKAWFGGVEIKRDDGLRGGGRNGDWITSAEDIEVIPRNTYCGDRNKKEV